MDWYSMTDPAIVKEIARRFKKRRLEKNYSQQEIAERAGISRYTVNFFENGKTITLTSFIQLLRALKELDELELFLPDLGIDAKTLLKLKKRERQRATGKHNKSI